MIDMKEIEFGEYPSHWQLASISELQQKDIILIEDGNHGNYRPLLHEFVSEGVSYVKAGDIENQQVDFKKALRINDDAFLRIRKGKGSNGDTIITHKGTVGNVAYIPNDNKFNFVCSPQTTFYRSLDSLKLNGEYIYYFLLSPFFQNQFHSMSGESDMAPYVSLTNQRSISFLIPPINEQISIVNQLSIISQKIRLLLSQNVTLEKMTETLFRQWFMEEAKEDWASRPLSSIANFLNGLACQKFPPKNETEKLPVLKIKELSSGITENSDWATTEVKPEYIVKNGDVIFAWSASLMVKIWDGQDCILNQHLFKVTSEDYPKWFYLLWCKHHLDEFIAKAASHATTMGHIKRGDLDEAMVLIPSTKELEEMTLETEPFIEKIIANNKQIKLLVNLRDTLLPKLMSGEVTVEQ
jgi:type I restriction enzyme S subunit